MKTLIVCYSFTGNNEKLAHTLREMVDCDLLKIEPRKKRTGFSIFLDLVFNRKPEIKSYAHPIQDYDQFILVAPVYASRIAAPLKTFLLQEKSNLHRYSFITLCGGVAGQKEKITKDLARLIGVEPTRVTELWVNDLLAENQKDTVKYTTSYRVDTQDLTKFNSKIREFLRAVEPEFETALF